VAFRTFLLKLLKFGLKILGALGGTGGAILTGGTGTEVFLFSLGESIAYFTTIFW